MAVVDSDFHQFLVWLDHTWHGFPFRLVKFGFKDGICTAIYTAICWTIPIITSAMVVDFSAIDLHSHLEESTCSTWVILASTSKVFKTWTHGSVLSMAWSCWCVAMAIFGPTRHDVARCYRCVSCFAISIHLKSTWNLPCLWWLWLNTIWTVSMPH